MSRGKKWYKKPDYDAPREPFNPGDGSLIQVVEDPDPTHPEALKVTRIWPDGELVTVVRHCPPTKYSARLILSVENDIERVEPTPQQKENMNYFNENIGSSHYRAPYAITSIIPGQKPGETYDPATNTHHKTRADFSKYYEDNGLVQVGPADIANMKLKQTDGHGEQIKLPQGTTIGHYDTSNPLRPPPGFEGVKFYSSS